MIYEFVNYVHRRFLELRICVMWWYSSCRSVKTRYYYCRNVVFLLYGSASVGEYGVLYAILVHINDVALHLFDCKRSCHMWQLLVLLGNYLPFFLDQRQQWMVHISLFLTVTVGRVFSPKYRIYLACHLLKTFEALFCIAATSCNHVWGKPFRSVSLAAFLCMVDVQTAIVGSRWYLHSATINGVCLVERCAWTLYLRFNCGPNTSWFC